MADVLSAEPRYDVAVAGGGVVGAAAALGIAAEGHRVLLVEPDEPTLQRGVLGVDLRTLAVSPASRDLLDVLDVWRGLPAAPYRRMEVWEERGTRAMSFDATEVSRQELGWIVENGAVAAALWDGLRRHELVTIRPARLLTVKPTPDQVDLTLSDGTASARLVLAADGARSKVRECLGVTVRRFDVDQVAVATAIRTARPHDDAAYQRFLLDGPIALLPTPDARLCSVVWSQSPEQAERRRDLDDDAFAAELERAVQRRLGRVEAVDRRLSFPLGQQLAASFNPHARVVLLGDAGRVLHPLAGLGANLGFEDVREVLAVMAGVGPGSDPGSPGLWRRFDRQRRTRAELMLQVMNGLRRVYARGDPWSQWLRNLGVGWLDRAMPVKRQIMVEAMGLGPVSRGRWRPSG